MEYTSSRLAWLQSIDTPLALMGPAHVRGFPLVVTRPFCNGGRRSAPKCRGLPAHAGFRAPPSPAVGGAWYSFSTMILPHDERGIRWVRSILKVRRHPQYLECKALQFKA